MTFTAVWRGVSLGLFLLALAAIVHFDPDRWEWIFVVMAGMSFVNAVGKGRWRWAPQPLMWGLGLAYAYSSPDEGPGHVGGWTMFLALCGASIVLSFLTNLVPKRPPGERSAPPRRPGAGIVIDVDAERSGDDR